MVTNFFVLKNAELFVREPVAGNAVAVKNAGVRRQTRQHRRDRIAFGPVENFGQGGPIWFFPQIRLARFGAGHNHAIKPAVQQVVDAEIEAFQMLLPCDRCGEVQAASIA